MALRLDTYSAQVITSAASGKALNKSGGEWGVDASIAISPDGNHGVASDNSYEGPNGGSFLVRVLDVINGKTLHTLKDHLGAVNSVAFSANGKRIVSGGGDYHVEGQKYDDYTVRVWDAVRGRLITRLKGLSSPVRSVAISPNGRRVVAGSAGNALRMWSVRKGKPIVTLKGHLSSVISLAFSPDGKYLASGSRDNIVGLWSVAKGKLIAILTGHTGEVRCVAFSPDGKFIVSAGSDQTVRFWDASTFEPLATLNGHSSEVNSVAFSPKGNLIISGSDDKTIKIWQVPNR